MPPAGPGVELADIFAEMSKKGDHFALRSSRPERGWMRRRGDLHPYTGGLPATRVALTQREHVRAERTNKKGVAEQRNFPCEGGCLLANATTVADTRTYEYRHSGTTVLILCDSTVLVD